MHRRRMQKGGRALKLPSRLCGAVEICLSPQFKDEYPLLAPTEKMSKSLQ